MLAAVDLDDQPRFDANEVGDVVSNRNLTSKAIATELATAQAIP